VVSWRPFIKGKSETSGWAFTSSEVPRRRIEVVTFFFSPDLAMFFFAVLGLPWVTCKAAKMMILQTWEN
jgi:hypothetical protein